jgi:hypothetical protein
MIGFGFGMGSIPGAGTANASHYVRLGAFSAEAELLITHVPTKRFLGSRVSSSRRANSA